MISNSQEVSGLDQVFARAIEQNPHNHDLLKAFQPIVTRQRQLAQSSDSRPLDISSIDIEKLKAGVPVVQQIRLFSPETPWKETAALLASAIKEGLPSLSEELDNLFLFIQRGRLRLFDYLSASPDGESNIMEHWVKELELAPGPALFLLTSIKRVALERRARQIVAALGDFPWAKGYCPICGDFPSIALIEETGGKRFLHCSSCGHDWRFTRVVCPYCENQAQQGMTYFYIEGRPQESAFICEKCQKYLVTLNRASHILDRDLDVTAMSLVHLDVLMQEKGYTPMVSCCWNALS